MHIWEGGGVYDCPRDSLLVVIVGDWGLIGQVGNQPGTDIPRKRGEAKPRDPKERPTAHPRRASGVRPTCLTKLTLV